MTDKVRMAINCSIRNKSEGLVKRQAPKAGWRRLRRRFTRSVWGQVWRPVVEQLQRVGVGDVK